jgi:hypothetical protein
VGTTIYPGMQATAVLLQKFWLPFWFGLRYKFGFSIPDNVVITSAASHAAKDDSLMVSLLARTMNSMGVSWVEMNLNDVCCLMPAWFGAVATLFTGLLALECSASFQSSGGGSFGTVLDFLPGVGWYIQNSCKWIRSNLAYYSGLDVDSSMYSHSSSCLQTTSLMCMLGTMFFMSIVPAHLMRSVGGGFDNESVAVTAMTCVFYLWTRSLRDNVSTRADSKPSVVDAHIRQKQDVGFTVSANTQSAVMWGALTGVAYFNMVSD